MKSSVLRDVKPSSPLKVNQHFRGAYFYLQGRKVRQVRIQHEAGSTQLAGGNLFHKNIAEDRIPHCYSHIYAFLLDLMIST
jgi:hypothetical protein